MKKHIFLRLIACFLICVSSNTQAQSKRYDIAIQDLPKDVLNTLEEYVKTLKNAEDLDACAKAFIKIAGGGLVNEDGESLRNSIKPYSLKKDFNNIKFYASPIKITRVNSNPVYIASGFGASAIKGRVYKIWINKASGQAGLPAPISIMAPDGHPTIKTPKVIRIGSL